MKSTSNGPIPEAKLSDIRYTIGTESPDKDAIGEIKYLFVRLVPELDK